MSKRMLTAADSQNLALRMENRANSRLTEERHSEREDLRLAAAVIRKTAVRRVRQKVRLRHRGAAGGS